MQNEGKEVWVMECFYRSVMENREITFFAYNILDL